MTSRAAYFRDYYMLTRAIAGREPTRDPAPIREHLTRLRAAGMTVRQIADAAGVHPKTVEHILRRSKRVNAPTARALLSVQPAPTPVGIVRRMRALAALGWTAVEIADLGDLTLAQVKHYRAGRLTYTCPEVAQAVVQVFDRLAMTTPPPTPAHLRTRTMAAARGWAPPLAWDDIDDPDETPNLGAARDDDIDPVAVELAIDGADVRLTRAERAEVARRMAEQGASDRQIAAILGVSASGVQRLRARHGIPARQETAA